jgi:hypothetical protein
VSGYTKLFDSIFMSTIWLEDNATRIVWIALLGKKDRHGIVEGSIPGLAHLARVTVDEAEAAINKFLAPDPHSRTSDHDGRRIERVDGGWLVLNHEKYRDMLSKEDKLDRDRVRQQRKRDHLKLSARSVTNVDESDESENVRDVAHTDPISQNPKTQEPTPLGHSPNDRKVFSDSLPSSENGEEQTPEGVVNSPFTICDARAKQKERDVRPLKAKLAVLAAAIYHEYPRKVAKATALKEIGKSITTVAKRGATDNHEAFNGDIDLAAGWLKSRTVLFAKSPQGRREDKTFIPHPATWFHRGQYDDDPSEWKNVGTSGGPKGSPVRELTYEDPSAGFEDVLSRPESAWEEGA